jgi:hypothetical protein
MAFRMGHEYLEMPAETRCFGQPVGHEGGGDPQQMGPGAPLLLLACGLQAAQQGQYLDGLAQAHVIGQAGARAQVAEQVEPGQPVALAGS